MFKQLIFKYAPEFLLKKAMKINKDLRRKKLQNQRENSGGINKEKLIHDFKKIGITQGDSVLVHSSMSKIGFVEGGAITIVDALFEVVGESGTLLFPTFPGSGSNKAFLETQPVFDIKNTSSSVGVITEYFRKLPGVHRSFHPTDPVCAKGHLAEFYTNSHFGQLVPHNEFSPFRKLCDKQGKILLIGTTLKDTCTSFHILEDAVDFKYPIYDATIFEAKMIDEKGNEQVMKTKAHNPVYSAKRDTEKIKPLFIKEGVLVDGNIGNAKSMLLKADVMFKVMLKYYHENGVTIYTPLGEA